MKNYIFNTSQFSAILESYNNIEGGNAKALIRLGKIQMLDGKLVEGHDFVDLVNGALAYFKNKYPDEYTFFRNATIIYVSDFEFCPTMMVDANMVYYINISFLYLPQPFGLGMDMINVFNILYHEAMHAMLEHIQRMKMWNENSKEKATWTDMNIAGDLEINTMMVTDKVCKKAFWEKQEGCYDDEVVGRPFETIIGDYRDIVNKFKKEKSISPNNKQQNQQNQQKKEQEKIPTSDEWKKGHKEARELIRKLYRKNKRNISDTLTEIDDITSNNNGDIIKSIDEIKGIVSEE